MHYLYTYRHEWVSETLYMRISTQNIACSQHQMNTCHTSFSYILWERKRESKCFVDAVRCYYFVKYNTVINCKLLKGFVYMSHIPTYIVLYSSCRSRLASWLCPGPVTDYPWGAPRTAVKAMISLEITMRCYMHSCQSNDFFRDHHEVLHAQLSKQWFL